MKLSKSEIAVLNALKARVGWNKPMDLAVHLNAESRPFTYKAKGVKDLCESLVCMKVAERMGDTYRYKGFNW
jgi:hypothetical protein